MAKDVLITPLDGIIQFSSSAGAGTGQIKVDSDDLVISNLVGDVLLGDGASDVFIGNGTDNVDIVFEQNGEIRDDGSGKTITLGSKTTTLILSSSSDITLQGGGGNVGIGTSTAGEALEVIGNISASGNVIANQITASGRISASGNIIAPAVMINGSDALSFTGNTLRLGLSNNEFTTINIGKAGGTNQSINVSGPITASGNISASGDVKGSTLTGTLSTAAQGNITSLGTLTTLTVDDITINGSEISDGGAMTIEAGGNMSLQTTANDIFISPAGKDVSLTDGSGTAEFIFNLEDAPELDVDGDFTIDGSGLIKLDSATSNIDLVGNVTASGNISASGYGPNGLVDISKVEGSEIARISVDSAAAVNNSGIHFNVDGTDKIRIQKANLSTQFQSDVETFGGEIFFASASGHITASGNISASGNILANQYIVEGNILSAMSGDTIALGFQNNTPISVGKNGVNPISLKGVITASGNISASGTSHTFGGNIAIDNEIQHIGDADTKIGFTDDVISFKAGNNNSNFRSTGFEQEGHITASGNISASGDVYAEDYYVENKIFASYASLTDTIDFGNPTQNIGYNGATHKFTNNVTASGNISASGAVRSEDASVSDLLNVGRIRGNGNSIAGHLSVQTPVNFGNHITASGNISASGNAQVNQITASAFQFVGSGDAELEVQGHITASGNISASGNFIGNRRFDITNTTDADHQGDIVYIGNTSTTAGRIYHYKSDGTWEPADPNSASTSDGLLAVALGSNSTTNGMLLRGMVTLDHDPGAVGDVLYLNEAAAPSGPSFGRATDGAPAGNGDIVRVIGYCLDASNGQIYFNPDNTFVEVSA